MPRYWRQGYGYEATQTWLDYGSGTMRLPRICAYADTKNTGSRRILEKAARQPSNEFDGAGIRHEWYKTSNPRQL